MIKGTEIRTVKVHPRVRSNLRTHASSTTPKWKQTVNVDPHTSIHVANTFPIVTFPKSRFQGSPSFAFALLLLPLTPECGGGGTSLEPKHTSTSINGKIHGLFGTASVSTRI